MESEQASRLISAKPPQTAQPFRFSTSLILQEATGLRAARLRSLAQLLRVVPDSCIYYHTHYFLLQHHYLTPEPSNDFAYWVGEVLGEEALGERLAGLDIMEHISLSTLRQRLVDIIEHYLRRTPTARFKFASEGEEFFFIKSVQVILPTPYTAATLAEFADMLERVSVRSLYFHVFDARLRLGRKTNDFSLWLEQLGYPELAQEIAGLDPYDYTLESLRSLMLSLVRRALGR